jgi:hypothetical protein
MFEAGSLSIENTFFYNNRGLTTTIPYAANPVKDAAGKVTNDDASRFANDTIFKEPEQFLVEALHNQVVEPKLTAAQDLKAPNFAPPAGSLALVAENAAVPPAGGFFDTSARFVGAVGTDNWLAGWTAYPEN